jgi:MFS transporter, DHA2 family, multidrug resistance protein
MTESTPHVNRWIVSLSVVFATFMEVLDTTVVNVSLPHIAGSMSSTVEEGTWTLTSYLVANAIILPMTGWLSRQFGRKRLLMTAVASFTVASFMCGLAPNLTSLIIFRVIQGASGGTMQPLSQSIMLEAFPPEERGKAMAAWALCIVTAPILGPVVGGWLTDTFSWRWIFYINIPIGIISLIMAKMFVFDPSYLKKKSEGVDYWGISMLALGMAALQIMLDKGQQEDWFSSDMITVLAIIAVVFLLTFIAYEFFARHPILDLRVFRDRSYAVGVFMMTIVGFVLYGSLVLLPIILQTLLGYPSLQAGIAMAPRGFGSMLFMPVVGLTMNRIGARKFLVAGIAICAFTLFWLGQLNLNAGYWDFFWPQFVQGISMSLLFVPMTTIAMNAIPREEMGNATSIFNLMRNIGGSIGIATAATLLERNRQIYTNVLGTHISPYAQQTQQMLAQARSAMIAGGSDPASASQKAHAIIFGMVQRQATMLSFINVFRLFGALFILIIPLIWLAKPPRTKKLEARSRKPE